MPAKPLINWGKENLHRLMLLQSFSQYFAKRRTALIAPHIKGKKVLDIGLGMGTLSVNLRNLGYLVVGVDVDDTSLYPDLKPIIYDGYDMPFGNNQFDTSICICVLHHCKDQEMVLREAMRVSKRLIVIEDTFRNKIEHLLVAVRDSIENWEFYYHQYRSYEEWKTLCTSNGWKVKYIKSWSSLDFGFLYGRQSMFTIEK